MRSRQLFQASAGLLGVGLALATPALAQFPPVDVTQRLPCDVGVPCHELRIELRQPATALTAFRLARIKLLFERVAGLDDGSFLVTARQTTDQALAGRLPQGVFVNSGLPWLISITPSPHSKVKSQGQWTAILQTDNIEFDSSTGTARLFRADPGGTFVDVTASVGLGSYLINSGGGDFGEFAVVTDLRQPDKGAFASYARLEAEIRAGAAATPPTINAASAAVLLDALARSRDAFGRTSRTRAAALIPLDELIAQAELRSGSGIEDRWDPATGRVSVAGFVRAFAAATRLAVGLATRPRAVSTASLVRQLTTASKKTLQVEVSFPGQVGDLGDALDISARDIQPGEMTSFVARLPKGVTIPKAFPVVIHVGPTANASFRIGFRGPVEIQVVTDNLDFTANSPLRLYKAPNEVAPFSDITAMLGIDSVRTGGKSPKFSQFVLAVDRRPLKEVSNEKLDLLDQQLDDFASLINPGLRSQLQAKLDQARTLAAGTSNKRLRRAIGLVNEFAALVDTNAGVFIPDVHREGNGGVNAAGTLIGGAHSLRLTLTLRLKPESP